MTDWTYVSQLPIDDWRNVPSAWIWTTLYHAEIDPLGLGDAVAGDDLDEICWVDITAIDIKDISPSHRQMFIQLRLHLKLGDKNE